MGERELQSMSEKTSSNDTSLRVHEIKKVAANGNSAIILTEKEEELLNMYEDSLNAFMIRKRDIQETRNDMIVSLSRKASLLSGMVVISFAICFALLDPQSQLKLSVILFVLMVLAISVRFSFTIRSFKGRYINWKEQVEKLQCEYVHYLKLAQEFVAGISNRALGNEILLKNNEIKMPKTGYLMAGINYMPVRYRMDMLVDDNFVGIGRLSIKSTIIAILVTNLATVLLFGVLAVYVTFSIISSSSNV